MNIKLPIGFVSNLKVKVKVVWLQIGWFFIATCDLPLKLSLSISFYLSVCLCFYFKVLLTIAKLTKASIVLSLVENFKFFIVCKQTLNWLKTTFYLFFLLFFAKHLINARIEILENCKFWFFDERLEKFIRFFV